jgi:hypothetical protein
MRTIEKQVMGVGLRRGPEVGWVRLTTSGVGEGGALLYVWDGRIPINLPVSLRATTIVYHAVDSS